MTFRIEVPLMFNLQPKPLYRFIIISFYLISFFLQIIPSYESQLKYRPNYILNQPNKQ